MRGAVVSSIADNYTSAEFPVIVFCRANIRHTTISAPAGGMMVLIEFPVNADCLHGCMILEWYVTGFGNIDHKAA